MDSINSPALIAVSGISSSTLKMHLPAALVLSSLPVNRREVRAASTIIIDVPSESIKADRTLSTLVAYPRSNKKIVYVVGDMHNPATRNIARYWICQGIPFDEDAAFLYDFDTMTFCVMYL